MREEILDSWCVDPSLDWEEIAELDLQNYEKI
jgi:hypothetical protein